MRVRFCSQTFLPSTSCNCNDEDLLPSVSRISGAKACLSGPGVTNQPSPARWWNQRERYIKIHRAVDKLFLDEVEGQIPQRIPKSSGRLSAVLLCLAVPAVVAASGGLLKRLRPHFMTECSKDGNPGITHIKPSLSLGVVAHRVGRWGKHANCCQSLEFQHRKPPHPHQN